MKERDIVYQNGSFWVGKFIGCYGVYQDVNGYAISDSSYSKDEDGLSIAKARCGYRAKRAAA